ncbi:SmpA / OmlA family protein [Pseudoruegeria aquimaris]|uniref:SmpA / OmlA family protein n=1 Tax=Pseudoruegeria aquimaris TaxID=393663 RepID=A0A1Y5RDW1_9RHOB|nr:outer membrane protein assembly factor BamE [Pseudoruegeria aquimaris]SLN12416.1 SmpA / OmlA family protein [Pseudoruegeria aquimaris]
MRKGWIAGKSIAALGVAFMLSACAATYQNHGFAPSELDLAEITVGVDTRDTLAETIGEPTISGVVGDDSWFYVGSRWRHFAFRAPEVIDRQVVAVSFAEDGVITNIERFGLENGRVVTLNRRVTETNIANVNLITQIINSVGNVSADQLVGN